jgi:hypothetical protein
MCKFIALLAVGLFIASSALAHGPINVQHLPSGGGFATGSVLAGGNGGGGLDCWTVDSLLVCRVIEAGGEAAFCSSGNPEHLAAVRGLPDDACFWMTFDADGNCTSIITHTGTNGQH